MRARLPFFAALAFGLATGIALSVAPSAEASRNSSGTYTLPGGNPVVTGTSISSAWANSTLGDLATEITNSLDRQGRGPMLAPLRLAAGAVSAPGLSWSADSDSGLYSVASGTVGLSVDSTQVQRWTSTGSTLSVPLSCSGSCSLLTGLAVTGAASVSGQATFNNGGPGLQLKPGSQDSTYIEFYARTASPGTRSAYIGYANPGETFLSIVAGLAGGIYIDSGPGTISLNTDQVFIDGANAVAATAHTNRLTPKNIVKAWARLDVVGGGSTTVTVADGFNVSGAASSGTSLNVTLASAFASTNYAIFVTPSSSVLACSGTPNTASSILITCRDISGSTVPFPFHNFQTGAARTVYVMAVGAQ